MNRAKMKDKPQMKVVKKLNYFDYAATSPMREEALTMYVRVAREIYGNTQSLHDVGTHAASLLTKCQQFWGSQFGSSGEGVFFTSSASEANQLAIRSLVKGKKGTILASPLEHASILIVLGELVEEGYEVKWLSLDEDGTVSIPSLYGLLSEDTLLIITQWVNSETGIIQPVDEILQAAKDFSVPVHCDAVQGFAKLELPTWISEVGSLVLSAHKFGGPKGCGIAWINPKRHWSPVYPGATHQSGFRAGTLDLPAIASATIAGELALNEQPQLLQNIQSLHQRLVEELPSRIYMVGNTSPKSPYILGLLGLGVDGQHAMLEANRARIALSTGSACKIGHGEAMSALTSLGYPTDVARQFIRISLGYLTTEQELTILILWIKEFVGK